MLGDGPISAIARLPQEDAATLQERDRKRGCIYLQQCDWGAVLPGAGYAGSRSSRTWDHVLIDHTARSIYRTLEQLVSNWLCHGRCYVPCRTSAVLIYPAL
jgi:hypothetical protein